MSSRILHEEALRRLPHLPVQPRAVLAQTQPIGLCLGTLLPTHLRQPQMEIPHRSRYRTSANWAMPDGNADAFGGAPPSPLGVGLPGSITSGARSSIFLLPPSPSTTSGGYRRTDGPAPGFHSASGGNGLGSKLLLCDGTG